MARRAYVRLLLILALSNVINLISLTSAAKDKTPNIIIISPPAADYGPPPPPPPPHPHHMMPHPMQMQMNMPMPMPMQMPMSMMGFGGLLNKANFLNSMNQRMGAGFNGGGFGGGDFGGDMGGMESSIHEIIGPGPGGMGPINGMGMGGPMSGLGALQAQMAQMGMGMGGMGGMPNLVILP